MALRPFVPSSMASNKDLQISTSASGAPLTPDHKRFNTLIRQIAQARQTHAEWQENIPLFEQTYAKVVHPLQASIADMTRKLIFALDALLDQPGWSRTERTQLRELVCGTAGQLLSTRGPDEELQALFDKHSDIDFETGRQQQLADFKELTEHFTGVDLGSLDGIASEDDLAERMFEQMAAQNAAAAERRAAKAARKGKSAAQRKAEEQAKAALQSVREIYRKLASAVHPDRELDPALRADRTTLMQKINQAYAANDLLSLLEIQVQLEQIDPKAIGNIGAQRLKLYNKVLADQLAGLKEAIAHVEADFQHHYGFDPFRMMHPRKLGELIQERAGDLRAGVAQQQRDLRTLRDRVTAKKWLKQQRRMADYDAEWER